MTNITDFEREIEAQDARTTASMLDLAHTIAELNEALKPLEDAKKKAVEQLKQAMLLSDLNELHDAERGITARIQERKGTPTYDLVRLVESTEGCEALVSAAGAGMVRIDNTMLSRFRKDAGASWADAIARVEMPGTGTQALVVTNDH